MEDSIKPAEKYLSDNSSISKHFNKVLQLIDGFETPYGLELLSTVHWTIHEENIDVFSEIVKFIQNWSQRKKYLFSDKHIQIAKQRLQEIGFN